MATLELLSDEYKVINGWYGKCHDSSGELIDLESCPEFDLNSATAHIRSVYWIKSDNTIATFNAGADAGLQDFTKLKCGAAYIIYLQKGTGTFDIPNFVASYSDKSMQGRITDNCDTGGASFSFETISNISEELDEGYTFEGSSEYDSSPHIGVITSITEAQNVTIQASGNNLQYSINGTDWIDIATAPKTITENFTNLQIRTRLGLSSRTISRTITLIASPINDAFLNIEKTITYNSTINNVTLTASKDVDEVIEEGSVGSEYSFDISYEHLKSIVIAGGTSTGYQVSTTSGSGYQNSLTLENSTLTSSPITIYLKLNSPMPGAPVSNVISVTGKRRTSAGDMVLTNAVTADATVAPRPQISSLSVNPSTLRVTAVFTNRTNYGGHHWHYEVVYKQDNSTVVSGQMPQFDSVVTMNYGDFEKAGVYQIKAWIVTSGHAKIPGSDDKFADFTIAANDASLTLNKSGISLVQDVDGIIYNNTVTISTNNLDNIRFSPTQFTNWELVSSSNSSFVIKLKNSVKSLDLSSGFKTLAQETITVTGDVGIRDTSGNETLSESVTLDAKIVDSAEFTITPPSGQSNTITDNRNYGEGMVEFGPYTINADAVTLSASTLNNWEVEVNGNGTWTKTPSFSGNGTSTFKLRQPQTSVGDAYNDTLVITPTALASDHDPSDDPNAVTLTLNSKIIPLPATLISPGDQTLNAITSGQSPVSKSFTVTGNRIENITISNVSSGWNVTPNNPSLNGTVTIAYTGDAISVGEKTGTFKISAEAITGSVLSVSEYTVNLSLTVNPKVASITPTPSSVALDAITTGTSSDSKSTIITSENVSDIKITQIPSGFIVKNGSTTLNVNESIGTGATLNVTISDINTLGNRSGTIKLTATASPNSEFSNGSANFVLNVNTSARVDGLPTSLNLDKTTITDSVNQYEAIPTAQKIQITAKDNLQSIVISGGNASKYRVSATENGTYADSLTLDSSATEFWVKLMSTATQPQIKTTFIVSGVKSAIGASNPPNKSVVCTATVTPFTTTLNLNPTSVTETYEQDAVITAHQISVTQVNLSSIALTATGNYSISATENGSYGTSLSMTNVGTNFWVKLNSTSTAGSVTGKVTLVGSNTLGGGNTTKELNCSATINAPAPAADFFSFENATGSTIDLVLDFSALDAQEHDGMVGSFQAKFDGIKVASVDTSVSMVSEEYAYGASLGQAIFNFDQPNSVVLAWASTPADVPIRTPEEWNLFNFKFWQTNAKARYKFNLVSKSTITYNNDYDTFVQAPTDLSAGERRYSIKTSGNVLEV